MTERDTSKGTHQDDTGFRVHARIGHEPYRTDIQAGAHRLVADEPADLGGADMGPSPYDLLLAALGSCTAMTLRMYADRKGWPLEGVEVRLRHYKVHARDCAECESTVGKVDHIDRYIELHGALSDEQRARLVDIATRCPVNRTLTHEIKVRTLEGVPPCVPAP